MNDYVFIGKIVGTHGVKGELKLKCDLAFIDDVLNYDTSLYFGDSLEEEKIEKVRYHKKKYLVLLQGYDNINQVLKYLGKDVYIKKDEIKAPFHIKEDLLGLKVFANNKLLGEVTNLFNSGRENEVLEINNKILIPFHKNFIKDINYDKKEISIDIIEGLI